MPKKQHKHAHITAKVRVASSGALSSSVKQRPAFSRRCSDWLDWLSARLAG